MAAAPVDRQVIGLPRAQNGSSPQHLLTTVLGDYWLRRSEHIPAGALMALLGEFGVTPTGARAALSRLARRGLLVTSRRGRNSAYGFAPDTVDVLAAGGYRFVNFGREDEAWDGLWTIASFSLPERQGRLRYALHSQLRWLGMAPLYDGLWVSARPVADGCRLTLEAVGVRDATVFRAAEVPRSGRSALAAWDLDEIAQMYTGFIATYAPMRLRIESGELSSASALRARTGIMDSWRSFPGRDPDLPVELLPAPWPRRQAHDIFVGVYDLLGPLAAIRVQQILERWSPELAGLVQYRRTGDLLRDGADALARLGSR